MLDSNWGCLTLTVFVRQYDRGNLVCSWTATQGTRIGFRSALERRCSWCYQLLMQSSMTCLCSSSRSWAWCTQYNSSNTEDPVYGDTECGLSTGCHDGQQRISTICSVRLERHLFEHAYKHVEKVTIKNGLICNYSRSSRCCAVSLFASIAKSLHSRADVSSWDQSSFNIG